MINHLIKIVSLDFWGTLASPNPAFIVARDRYLSDLFGVPKAEAQARYKSVKDRFDYNAAHFGTAVTPLVAAKTLIEGMTLARKKSATDVASDFEQLVRGNPPILMKGISDIIGRLLRSRQVIRVGISANTDFVSLPLLMDIFQIELAYVSFTVSSGSLGVSKPDPEFFNSVLKKGVMFDVVAPHSFLHIGHHPVCDVRGAIKAGMDAILVRSPTDTLSVLEAVLDGKDLMGKRAA